MITVDYTTEYIGDPIICIYIYIYTYTYTYTYTYIPSQFLVSIRCVHFPPTLGIRESAATRDRSRAASSHLQGAEVVMDMSFATHPFFC